MAGLYIFGDLGVEFLWIFARIGCDVGGFLIDRFHHYHFLERESEGL